MVPIPGKISVRVAVFLLTGLLLATSMGCGTALERVQERPSAEKERPPVPEEPQARRPSGGMDKQKYLHEVSPLILKTADIMERVSQTLKDYADGSLKEKAAAEELRFLRDELNSIEREAESLSPPTEFEQFKTHFVKGLGLYVGGIDNAASGIEQVNPALLKESISLFEQSAVEMKEASIEFEKNTKEMHIMPKSVLDVLGSIKIPHIELDDLQPQP